MATDQDINSILTRLDYLEKLVQRHKHDGVETQELDDIVSGLTSPLTTKGDVWGYSGTDARIPIGTNGHVLTADSTQALGLKWAAPTSSSFVSPLTTKGDIHTFTTVDARLGVGSDGQTLYADSAQATGLRWGSPAAIGLTTKGDILCYSSAIDRLPVGTNGQILSANSSESTGLDWIDPTTVGFTSKARAYLSSDQTYNAGTTSKILLDTEVYDVDSEFDSTTDHDFTATTAGYYLVLFKVTTNQYNSSGETVQLYKNGSFLRGDQIHPFNNGVSTYGQLISFSIEYLSASDYLALYYSNPSGFTQKVNGDPNNSTYFIVHRIS